MIRESQPSRDLSEAVFVVVDLLDVDALTAIGFRATLAGVPSALLGYVLGVEAQDVVLVGAVDPRLASWLGIEAPDVMVRVLRGVESAALALGHRPDTDYGDVQAIDTKRETWLRIVADHARLADPGQLFAGVREAAAATQTIVRRATR